MTGPVVSVVVPAYQAAGHLAEAVASARAQTLDAIEILVVDDGSTDGTGAVARALAAEDPRVRVLGDGRNRGVAGARNLGLSAARGAWVAPLDADDRFLPTRLETLVTAAERLGSDMVADNVLLCRGSGPGEPMLPPGEVAGPTPVDAARYLERNLPVRGHPRLSYGFLKPVLRAGFLRRHGLAYDEALRFAEDFQFAVAALAAGARFHLLPDCLYAYAVRPDSLTATHGLEELVRLRLADDRLAALPGIRKDERTMAALRRHARSIDERIWWRRFSDALAARSPGGAATALLAGPGPMALILGECARRAPGKLYRVVASLIRQRPADARSGP